MLNRKHYFQLIYYSDVDIILDGNIKVAKKSSATKFHDFFMTIPQNSMTSISTYMLVGV